VTFLMHVEWTTPDEERRRAAHVEMRRQSGDLNHLMMSFRTKEERDAALVDRFPDLEAVVTHFGTMLSMAYIPAQHAVAYAGGFSSGTTGNAYKMELSKARWVALVATEDGTVEKDPTTLKVLGRYSGGDPICGRVPLRGER
jgi:hypothetical protein